jgi:hypothetical protein
MLKGAPVFSSFHDGQWSSSADNDVIQESEDNQDQAARDQCNHRLQDNNIIVSLCVIQTESQEVQISASPSTSVTLLLILAQIPGRKLRAFQGSRQETHRLF